MGCMYPTRALVGYMNALVFEKIGLWEVIPGEKIKGEEKEIFWSQNLA